MSFLRTSPLDLDVRSDIVEDDAPRFDGLGAAAVLAMAVAPTAFVLVAALQMFGVHAL